MCPEVSLRPRVAGVWMEGRKGRGPEEEEQWGLQPPKGVEKGGSSGRDWEARVSPACD